MKKPTMVIFGATGNLYLDKLAKALFLLFQEGQTLPKDFKIIAFARKDLTTENFRILTKEQILKRGQVDGIVLDDFVSHIEYFQGNFLEQADFVKLKEHLYSKANNSEEEILVLHLATPTFLYEDIFKNIKNADLHKQRGEFRIMTEKPFGRNEVEAKHLQSILSSFLSEKNIFRIDHYIAKETTRAILDFRFKDGSLESVWDGEHISKIKIIFHESNVVGSRGASYDAVGAFRDVGQNHMLEILALILMDKPASMDASLVRSSRATALENLHIDYSQQITKGQYESYLSSPGIEADSKTETFFWVILKSRDPRFSEVYFELESGKGLKDMNSDITTTTVAAQVYFKDGNDLPKMKEFKIQPLAGTLYDSYSKVYSDVLADDQTLFVSMDEVVSQWKLADELLEKWKDIPLVIYKDGSDPKDIK